MLLASVPVVDSSHLNSPIKRSTTGRKKTVIVDIPGPQSRNEGTFPKTALLQTRPSVSSRPVSTPGVSPQICGSLMLKDLRAAESISRI